ncbi:cytochrome P450 [Streptomyces sp. SL13]|uniref:Cytochrome P450 n=1 Tax=Streptantibioticus silvisoli TaxID=2705255 RepID=A0AA90H6R7_9ACTN|nr:cytochrome P450 [Streptantibioticus silvisoli]MDI5966258.1 cytochrome P450 [Streptantibioticus silvisoli]MDI5971599.1 cytochrome P450 [Streptantibioticus silvisoli]
MTNPPAGPSRADSSLAPPPGCPAHGLGPEGLRRLYGPEGDKPKALYEKLRSEHGPVAPVLVQGDLQAWLVLGHAENLEVARNPSRFARDPRTWRDMREGRVPADSPLGPMVSWVPVCNFTDGLEHDRLRSAVMDSLHRFDRRGIRRYVTRFANQLVDNFAANGHADLVEDFAAQLPMQVMTQLIGCPEEHSGQLVRAARDMLRGTETALKSDQEVTATLEKLVEARKAVPQADLTSWLLEHASGLADDEVLAHVRVVLIAAVETTANLIANTVQMVLTDHRFRAHLSGGQMTVPDALEQVLWDRPPINTVLGRWATGDTTLGDQRIQAGDMLLLGLAAGNVDPAIRPDPTAPVHGNRSHLAFSGGVHECPGQDIGRAIAGAGIDALLARLPDLELAVEEHELQWRGSLMFQHLVALPVTFTAQRVTTARPAAPEMPAEVPVPLPVPPGPEALAPEPQAPPQQRQRPWWVRWFGGGGH